MNKALRFKHNFFENVPQHYELSESDIEYIQQQIEEGYVEGEICSGENKYRGYWSKTKEEDKEDEVSINISNRVYKQLIDIQSELKTQNGRLSQNSAYEVRVIREISADPDYDSDGFNWVGVNDFEDIIEEGDVDKYFEIEEVKQDYKEYRKDHDDSYTEEDFLEYQGYERQYYTKQAEVNQVFLTEKAAQEYIDTHRHNLNEPFIFGTYIDKNKELLLVRNLILNLK